MYKEVSSRLLAGVALLLVSLVGVHVYEGSRTHDPTIALVEKAMPGVVVIECTVISDEGNTTITTAGFVMSDNGHIFTVAHGLPECAGKKQKNLRVRFWENPDVSHRVALLRMDVVQDAAILQVPTMPKDIEPLGVDFSFQSQGRRTFAIGHPLLLYWSVADGIVSSDRIWTNPVRHLIQVSIPLNPGNSGGPILNDEGLVIGVASFGIVGANSLSFIVPMDTFVKLAQGIYF